MCVFGLLQYANHIEVLLIGDTVYIIGMKLYVIGNGFDLAHELESSYSDYRTFIRQHATKANGWNIILEYYPTNHEFWSDAETYICKIDRKRFLEPKRILSFCDLDVLLKKIHESFEAFVIDLESQISAHKKKFVLDSDGLYLTFNYTSVLEDLYGIPKDRVIHLHNTASDAVLRTIFSLDSEEIVLGHGPLFDYFFYYKDFEIGSDRDYIAFRNKTLKNTGEIIKQHNLQAKLLMLQHSISEVVFYGFSFSPNDQDYVRLISTCLPLPETIYKVFYYVKESETPESAKERCVENMMKCAFAMEKTVFVVANGVTRL